MLKRYANMAKVFWVASLCFGMRVYVWFCMRVYVFGCEFMFGFVCEFMSHFKFRVYFLHFVVIL